MCFCEDNLQFVRKRFQLYRTHSFTKKKKPTPRWSGKNCYEKESDDKHHMTNVVLILVNPTINR